MDALVEFIAQHWGLITKICVGAALVSSLVFVGCLFLLRNIYHVPFIIWLEVIYCLIWSTLLFVLVLNNLLGTIAILLSYTFVIFVLLLAYRNIKELLLRD